MSVFCWIPGDNVNYSSYNGNFNLSKSRKTILAYTNTADIEPIPFITSKNLSIFRSGTNKYTVKTIGKSMKDEIVPMAAACDIDPASTASDDEQADNVTKTIYSYAKKMGLQIQAPELQQSIRSAQKMFGIDLFGIGDMLLGLDRWDVGSLKHYLDGLDGENIQRLRSYLGQMAGGGNGQIAIISSAAQQSLYQTMWFINTLSNIAGAYAIGKLIVGFIKWINMKEELSNYDKANNRSKNAQRIAYAKKMVDYLNNLKKDQKPLPPDVQKDLIAFFSSDENDAKELYTMTDNLAKIAKNKTMMDNIKLSLGLS